MIKRLFLATLLAGGVLMVNAEDKKCKDGASCQMGPQNYVEAPKVPEKLNGLVNKHIAAEFRGLIDVKDRSEIDVMLANGTSKDYFLNEVIKDFVKVYNQDGKEMPIKFVKFYDVSSIYRISRELPSCEPLMMTIVFDKVESVSKLIIGEATLTGLTKK